VQAYQMTDKSPLDPFGSIPIASEGEEKEIESPEPDISVREGLGGSETVSPSSAAAEEEHTKRLGPRRKPGQSRLVWLAILPLAGVVFYLLAGYLLAPHLLRTTLPNYLSRIMDRSVTIGAADFNPFTLTITLQNAIVGSRFTDPGDGVDPLLSFARLELDLAAASLIRFGLVCKKVEMDRFFLHLVRHQDSTYNIQDLLQSSAGRGWIPAAGSLRFSLNNISINDSRLVFDDRPAEKTHILEEINLALPTVANLAFRPDQYLHPRFSAKINGSPVELTGETKMEGGELEARLKLRLAQIDLPGYFEYLPIAANFLVSKGRADLDLDLVFQTGASNDARLQVEGTGRLTDVWLQTTADSREIARLPVVNGVLSFSPLSGRYRLRDLNLQQPDFLLERQPDDQWLFPRLNITAGTLEIDRLLVTGGRLSFIDRRVKGGFADTWSELQLSIEGFANESRKPATFAFSGRNREQARLSAQGHLFPGRNRAEGMLIGHQLQLPAYSPYLEENHALRLRDGNVIHLETGFTVVSEKNGRLEFSSSGLTTRIENLALVKNDEKWLHLPQLALENASLHWPDRRLELGKVQVNGGALLLDWDQEGKLNWQKWKKDDTAKRWQVAVKTGSLEETSVRLRTRTLSEPFVLELQNTTLMLADLTNLPGREGRLAGSFRLFGESPMEIDGVLQFDPFVARLQCVLEDLALQRLRPLFSGWFRPTIKAGVLGARGEIRLPGPVFQGAAQIDQFAASLDQKEILRWHRAASDNLTVQFSSGTLQAKKVFLQQPFAAWILADRSGSTPTDLFDLSWTAGNTPRLGLEQLTLAEGELAFTDPAASPPYSIRISGVAGTIDSLVSTVEGNSRLSLEGRDAKGASFALRGAFNPFGSRPVAEFTAEVRDFQLADLSPYLSHQLGYRLAGGTIALNGSLHLDQQQLRATNRLQVTGLQLGEQLASGSHLPVALALLTNRERRVDLDIPISGPVTAADFSYREELRRAVRHLLLKSAVSPFSVLMESTSSPALQEYFIFPPGRADLTPAVQNQLQHLAAVLLERPRLRLVLHGFAGDDNDREAIRTRRQAEERIRLLAREAQVSDKLATAYGREENTSLPPGTTAMPEPRQIVIPDDLLRELASSRSETVYQYLTKTHGIPAARVSFGPVGNPLPAGTPGRPANRVDIELKAGKI
jgi:hypothetical protein